MLTLGSTGRTPTFFKAFGHEDVFGLKANIPDGGITLDVLEGVPGVGGDDAVRGGDDAGVDVGGRENVLYVQLPEGHPIITRSQDEDEQQKRPEEEKQQQELSLEDAIEQAEIVFDDDDQIGGLDACESNSVVSAVMEDVDASAAADVVDGKVAARRSSPAAAAANPSVCLPIKVDVQQTTTTQTRSGGRTGATVSPAAAKRHSPRISSRQKQVLSSATANVDNLVDIVTCDSGRTESPSSALTSSPSVRSAAASPVPAATASTPTPGGSGHNLRPKRTLRHVNALKQQAKRRKKNTTLAAGGSPAIQRTLSTRRSNVNANGDIEIQYRPSSKELTENKRLDTMKDVLNSIPGFSLGGKNRNASKKASNKKLSAAAAIQQAREGIIDLETPDSILGQVNLRLLLNKATFAKLPPLFQFKLMQLLPQVDNVVDTTTRSVKLSQSSLNNEFFAKACQEWREQLNKGELLPEAIARAKSDEEKERLKLDPWKAKHFEPIWGQSRHDYSSWAAEEDAEELEAAVGRGTAAPTRTSRTRKRTAQKTIENIVKPDEEETEVSAKCRDSPKKAKVDKKEELEDAPTPTTGASTDEIDLARKVQSEIEESVLTFVGEDKKVHESQEERDIDDEMEERHEGKSRHFHFILLKFKKMPFFYSCD